MSDGTNHDVDGLLRKNAELLAEVKGLKAKVAEVEGERDAATGDAAMAREVARQVSIERPLEGVLGGAFVAPWRVVRPLLDEHFQFELADDGAASIKSVEGEALALDALFQAVLAIPDLAAMVKPARGAGAGGTGPVGRIEETATKPRVANQFGLR